MLKIEDKEVDGNEIANCSNTSCGSLATKKGRITVNNYSSDPKLLDGDERDREWRMEINNAHGLINERVNRKSFRFTSFTLVELLITIAIIAILSAILLPALTQAKGRVKTIHCISKLKQIGTALDMYITDNNDWSMQALMSRERPENYYESPAVYSGQVRWDWYIYPAGYLPFNRNNEMCRCTERSIRAPGTLDYGTYSGLGWYAMTSYGYTRSGGVPLSKRSLWRNPSVKLWVIDGTDFTTGNNYAVWYYYPENVSTTSRIETRHNKRANVLRLDGHVDNISRTEHQHGSTDLRTFIVNY